VLDLQTNKRYNNYYQHAFSYNLEMNTCQNITQEEKLLKEIFLLRVVATSGMKSIRPSGIRMTP